MFRLTLLGAALLMSACPMLPANAGADDVPFCADVFSCGAEGCAPETDVNAPPCISYEEAADLAVQPDSGVYEVTTRVEPQLYGAVNASAENANAICKDGSCFVKGDGQVSLSSFGHQSVFFGWSGCAESADSHLMVGPVTASTECVAHFGPGLIVVNASVAGNDGAKVQIAGSCTGAAHCSFLNGGSVTLTAPASTSIARFTGWSGCSMSTEPTISFTNVRDALPECVAQYAPVQSI